MESGNKALALHESGCNCCQSVLMSVCEEFGLSVEQAYQLAAFFGAGMRCGEVCGAVTGALMALGLKYGDEDNRQCGKSREFMKAFEAQYGAVICRQLLAKHQKKMCSTFIEYCANYLEEEFR